MHALPQATRAEAMGCRFNRICKLEESIPACLRAVNEASGASYSLANLDGVLAKYAGSTKDTDLHRRAARPAAAPRALLRGRGRRARTEARAAALRRRLRPLQLLARRPAPIEGQCVHSVCVFGSVCAPV